MEKRVSKDTITAEGLLSDYGLFVGTLCADRLDNEKFTVGSISPMSYLEEFMDQCWVPERAVCRDFLQNFYAFDAVESWISAIAWEEDEEQEEDFVREGSGEVARVSSYPGDVTRVSCYPGDVFKPTGVTLDDDDEGVGRRDPIVDPEFSCHVCGDFGNDASGFVEKYLCKKCYGDQMDGVITVDKDAEEEFELQDELFSVIGGWVASKLGSTEKLDKFFNYLDVAFENGEVIGHQEYVQSVVDALRRVK